MENKIDWELPRSTSELKEVARLVGVPVPDDVINQTNEAYGKTSRFDAQFIRPIEPKEQMTQVGKEGWE